MSNFCKQVSEMVFPLIPFELLCKGTVETYRQLYVNPGFIYKKSLEKIFRFNDGQIRIDALEELITSDRFNNLDDDCSKLLLKNKHKIIRVYDYSYTLFKLDFDMVNKSIYLSPRLYHIDNDKVRNNNNYPLFKDLLSKIETRDKILLSNADIDVFDFIFNNSEFIVADIISVIDQQKSIKWKEWEEIFELLDKTNLDEYYIKLFNKMVSSMDHQPNPDNYYFIMYNYSDNFYLKRDKTK